MHSMYEVYNTSAAVLENIFEDPFLNRSTADVCSDEFVGAHADYAATPGSLEDSFLEFLSEFPIQDVGIASVGDIGTAAVNFLESALECSTDRSLSLQDVLSTANELETSSSSDVESPLQFDISDLLVQSEADADSPSILDVEDKLSPVQSDFFPTLNKDHLSADSVTENFEHTVVESPEIPLPATSVSSQTPQPVMSVSSPAQEEVFLWRGGYQARCFSVNARFVILPASILGDHLRTAVSNNQIYARASLVFADDLTAVDSSASGDNHMASDKPFLAMIPPKRGRDSAGQRPHYQPISVLTRGDSDVLVAELTYLYITVLSRQFNGRLFRVKVWLIDATGSDVGVVGFSRPIDSKSNPKDVRNSGRPTLDVTVPISGLVPIGGTHAPLHVVVPPPVPAAAAAEGCAQQANRDLPPAKRARTSPKMASTPEPALSVAPNFGPEETLYTDGSMGAEDGLAAIVSIYQNGDETLRRSVRAYFLEQVLLSEQSKVPTAAPAGLRPPDPGGICV